MKNSYMKMNTKEKKQLDIINKQVKKKQLEAIKKQEKQLKNIKDK